MGQLSTSAGASATAASSQQAMTRQRVCFQTCQATAGVRSHVRRSIALGKSMKGIAACAVALEQLCHHNMYRNVFTNAFSTMRLLEQVHGHDFNAIAVLPRRDAYAAASEEKVSKLDRLHGPGRSV